MGTSKDRAQEILSKVEEVAEARIRPMMGEYILYVEDIVIGQINEGELFIKITDFGEGFAPELDRESPYGGAKPAFVVPVEKLEDDVWLHDFIAGTVGQLQSLKKK